MDQGLIDQIYECSFFPEIWPAVLDRLAEVTEARGAEFVVLSPDKMRWRASASLVDSMKMMASGGWMARCERVVRMRTARRAGFMTDLDLYTEEEMAADPFYRDLLWNCGLGWGAGTLVALPTGETLILSVERDRGRGPVEPETVQVLDGLRPHLARSALMSARLRLEQARAVSETLGLIGLASLVFEERGKVLAANALIEAMPEHVQWRARDRISLKDADANKLFQAAVATMSMEETVSVRSFAVRDGAKNAALVAHVLPIRGNARDIFARCTGVLVLTQVTAPQAPHVELVQSLFDLTPAEARVARGIATGDTLDEIAAGSSVSRNTVRTHVRGVLQKTGCRRQAEVVALLGGIMVPAG